jgi:hypothetical protein
VHQPAVYVLSEFAAEGAPLSSIVPIEQTSLIFFRKNGEVRLVGGVVYDAFDESLVKKLIAFSSWLFETAGRVKIHNSPMRMVGFGYRMPRNPKSIFSTYAQTVDAPTASEVDFGERKQELEKHASLLVHSVYLGLVPLFWAYMKDLVHRTLGRYVSGQANPTSLGWSPFTNLYITKDFHGTGHTHEQDAMQGFDVFLSADNHSDDMNNFTERYFVLKSLGCKFALKNNTVMPFDAHSVHHLSELGGNFGTGSSLYGIALVQRPYVVDRGDVLCKLMSACEEHVRDAKRKRCEVEV